MIGGFGSKLFVSNTLIYMYIKCGILECGHKLFDEMPEKNLISWKEVIVAYAKNGIVEIAYKLFDDFLMKDIVTWIGSSY